MIIKTCQRMIYWSLIAIPFVASFSSAAVNVFLGFCIFAFLSKKIAQKDFCLPKTVINLSFLLLIIFSIVSFLNSVSLRASIEGIWKLLKYGFLFIILASEVKDEKHTKRIILGIILGLCLASLDGIYQLYVGRDFFRGRFYDVAIGLPRLKAAFPHTNLFASYLALLLPVSMGLSRYYLKGRQRVVASIISALALFCLIFTFSRGAVAGFALAILFIALVKKDRLILMLLILSIISMPLLFPSNIRNWINQYDSVWDILIGEARMNIYKTSLNMINEHPFLGVGVNTYCLNYQKYKIQETSGFTYNGRYYAHNIYLHMAAETGLISLILFLWLLFRLFKKWASFFKSTKSDFLKTSSLVIMGGIIAFLFNGLTETNLYYPKIVILFWYQVGLLMGIYNLDKNNRI